MQNPITPQNLWSEMLKFKHLLGLKHGFTIPFIVGAYHKWGFITEEELSSSDCLRYLLNRILESISSDNPVKLIECDNMDNELVLQYLATDLSFEDVQDQKTSEPNIKDKLYWNRKETEVTNIDNLIEWLWTKPAVRGGKPYGELISLKCFSCNYGCWKHYNEMEEMFIKNINILDTVDYLNNLKQN